MKQKGRGITRTSTSKAIAARARTAMAKARTMKTGASKEEAAKAPPARAGEGASARPVNGGSGSRRTFASGMARMRGKGKEAASKSHAAGAGADSFSISASPDAPAPFIAPAQGDRAPGFSLETGDGRKVALSDFEGKAPVVLYFYPKDMTPGCTAEACAFRDAYARFKSAGAEILGISMDSPASHQGFSEKYGLPFPLLSDTEGTVSKAYGVYKEKNLYGRKFWGIERSTFLIDRQGRIRRAWRKVKVNGHEPEVLDTVKDLALR